MILDNDLPAERRFANLLPAAAAGRACVVCGITRAGPPARIRFVPVGISSVDRVTVFACAPPKRCAAPYVRPDAVVNRQP